MLRWVKTRTVSKCPKKGDLQLKTFHSFVSVYYGFSPKGIIVDSTADAEASFASQSDVHNLDFALDQGGPVSTKTLQPGQEDVRLEPFAWGEGLR